MSSTTHPSRPTPDDLFTALAQLSPGELVALIAEAGAELGRRGGQAWTTDPIIDLGIDLATDRTAAAATHRTSGSHGGTRCSLASPALASPARTAPALPRPAHRPTRRPAERLHPLTLHGISEDVPGSRWQQLFHATWPGYRAWFASEGLERRAGLKSSQQALRRYLPELVPTWERLVDLASGDLTAARMLALWNPPAFTPACSQLVLAGPPRLLVRNYDYDPALFESVVWGSRFGDRRVIGTADCLWGLLDGMNDDGLVVSLTFGGRPGSGSGFAIPLVVRYLLETCGSVAEARQALAHIPVAMSYNLTLSDRSGQVVTAFVAPDHPAEFHPAPLATNHRGRVPEHPDSARRINSVGRQTSLDALLRSEADPDAVIGAFLQPPLHNTAYSRGFGTLYTAAYRPDDGIVEYHWPGSSWRRTFDSPDDTVDVVLREPGHGVGWGA